MSDRYVDFVNSPLGQNLAKNLGLPQPVQLERYRLGDSMVSGDVLLGAAPGSALESQISETLTSASASVQTSFSEGKKYKAVIFDATGVENAAQLKSVYEFFKPVARSIASSGRVIIVGRVPEKCADVKQQTAQRALLGFIKAVGKEFKKGITANVIYVDNGAEKNLDSSLRFFVSPKSAYVSGQAVRVYKVAETKVTNPAQPLAGKTVVVTGAARGIGEAIAHVMARDGAHVICLDIPPAEEDLKKVSSAIGGSYLACDITAADAGEKIKAAADKQGGLYAIVHNAGVTRDKTLFKMDEKMWDMVMNINLISQENVNDYLIANGAFEKNGRIVCVSSISGIAGNLGQTNYAMSKAGVIGMVEGMQGTLKNGLTINAVAPGFIETEMTAAIPFTIREAGRRMNSMNQGGQPVDVAEAISWFASPASGGVKGNVVRVCGQSLIGA